MNDKTIPLQAVRDALMCAVVKTKVRGREISGKPHARTAAFTQVPHAFVYRCTDARKRRGRLPSPPWHFSPMDAGDMERLLQHVRVWHGRDEVRRTWGVGFRALKTEFTDGVMR